MDEITTSSEQGIQLIFVTGVLDRQLASRMREEAIRLSTLENAEAVILDMSEATHMDSMGVGMLVSTFKSCDSRNLKFALVGVRDKAAEVLRITRLDKLLPIYEDLSAARKALNL